MSDLAIVSTAGTGHGETASPIAYLGRRYHFSASHRLHTESLDEATNREVFGKCNNPHGHGHNYVVEVTVRGPVDRTTGMVVDLAALDQFAQERVLSLFDHQNLNLLPCFANAVPTSENLTLELFRIFRHFHGAEVVQVHVDETSNNSFNYTGELPGSAEASTPLVTHIREQGTDLVSGDATGSHAGAL